MYRKRRRKGFAPVNALLAHTRAAHELGYEIRQPLQAPWVPQSRSVVALSLGAALLIAAGLLILVHDLPGFVLWAIGAALIPQTRNLASFAEGRARTIRPGDLLSLGALRGICRCHCLAPLAHERTSYGNWHCQVL
jgi:hypothetical protein